MPVKDLFRPTLILALLAIVSLVSVAVEDIDVKINFDVKIGVEVDVAADVDVNADVDVDGVVGFGAGDIPDAILWDILGQARLASF